MAGQAVRVNELCGQHMAGLAIGALRLKRTLHEQRKEKWRIIS